MRSPVSKRLAAAAAASGLALALTIPVPALARGDAGIWSLGAALQTVVEPALESMLEGAEHGTGAALAGEALEAVGKALLVGEIAGKIVTQLGYEVTVDTEYEPEDGPVAVHLQDDHTKQLSERSVVLKAKVEFKNDWESKLPAPTLRKVLGMGLPEKGLAKNVVVNWYFPDKLFRYATVLDGDFPAGTNPTFSSKTGEDGVAKGTLHPVKEDFLFGGIKRVEEMKIKAVAQVQAAQGMPGGVVSAAAPLVDQILATAQGPGVVRIERHVPTEWEGSFEIHRSVNASWNVTRPIPADRSKSAGMFSTRASGTELWQGTLKIPAMHFTTGGVGSGEYEYKLTGDQSIRQEQRGNIWCDDKLRAVVDTLDVKGRGDGVEFGKGSASLVAKGIGGGKLAYAMTWSGSGAGSSAITSPRFSGRAQSVHSWTDCDGQHKVADEVPLTSRLGISQQMVLSGPITPSQNLWLPFDPTAKELAGELSWDERPNLGQDAPTFWMSTTIAWNIKRVIPK